MPNQYTPSNQFTGLFNCILPLNRVRRWLSDWHPPEEAVLITTAIAVGIGTGFLVAGFIWLVEMFSALADSINITSFEWADRILIMGGAGLLVGALIHYLAPEVQGSGIPEVMEAVALRSGQMRARIIPLKILATALTIGAGGSAGREGPIVQIGSALGSNLGKLLHFGNDRVRTMIACGAAAGIAAAFNAPIAASLFALEVVLGTFNVRSFGTVVISAVSGGVMSRILLGDQPAFLVPAYPLSHLGELMIYTVLGGLAAVVAALFIYMRQQTGRLFEAMPLSLPFRASIGMMLAAIVSLPLSAGEMRGSGLEWIGNVITFDANLAVSSLLSLLIIKLLATCFTLGGGTSGGVFAPSLFLGAALGSIVGSVAHTIWPTVAVNPGAYAIVGMAAVFSAAVRTPITAVIIVFEMSNDYKLILPLLLVTAVSTVLSERLSTDSLYTMVLKAKGIVLQGGRDVDILDSVLVDEIMARDIRTVLSDMSLVDLSELFSQTHSHGFLVLNRHGKLAGVVTITDLDRAVADKLPRTTTVEEISTGCEKLLVAYPDESIGEALARMGVRGFGRLPVVLRDDERHVVGLIRREEILRAYNMALTRRAELQHRAKRAEIRNTDDTEFVDLVLTSNDQAVGRTIQEIGPQLPHECILISVRRDGKMLIPHGNTIFQHGDDVTAFIASKDFEAFRDCLKGEER